MFYKQPIDTEGRRRTADKHHPHPWVILVHFLRSLNSAHTVSSATWTCAAGWWYDASIDHTRNTITVTEFKTDFIPGICECHLLVVIRR
jgi:hypothetical protein